MHTILKNKVNIDNFFKNVDNIEVYGLIQENIFSETTVLKSNDSVLLIIATDIL